MSIKCHHTSTVVIILIYFSIEHYSSEIVITILYYTDSTVWWCFIDIYCTCTMYIIIVLHLYDYTLQLITKVVIHSLYQICCWMCRILTSKALYIINYNMSCVLCTTPCKEIMAKCGIQLLDILFIIILSSVVFQFLHLTSDSRHTAFIRSVQPTYTIA